MNGLLCSTRKWMNGQASLGMPDCEWLKHRNVNYQKSDEPRRKCQIIRKQTKLSSKQEIMIKIASGLTTKLIWKADYIVAGPITETHLATSPKPTIKKHNEFSNVFTGIGCFKDIISLKVKEDDKWHQVWPRC